MSFPSTTRTASRADPPRGCSSRSLGLQPAGQHGRRSPGDPVPISGSGSRALALTSARGAATTASGRDVRHFYVHTLTPPPRVAGASAMQHLASAHAAGRAEREPEPGYQSKGTEEAVDMHGPRAVFRLAEEVCRLAEKSRNVKCMAALLLNRTTERPPSPQKIKRCANSSKRHPAAT
jgi:hypothetical protein